MSEWNLSSAQSAFDRGDGQTWIEDYLQQPEWLNEGLLARVRSYSSSWLAPEQISPDAFFRIAGPGDGFMFPQDLVKWKREVAVIVSSRPSPEDLPPLIAWRELDGILNLADGNHRLDALRELGHNEAWTIVHDGPLRSPEEIRQRAERLAASPPPKQS